MDENLITDKKYYEIKKESINHVLIIFIIGFTIGLALILTGFIRKTIISNQNEEFYQKAFDDSEYKAKEAQKKLDEIKIEYNNLLKEVEIKNNECNTSDIELSNNCKQELKNLKLKVNELEEEKSKLENDNYTVYYKIISPFKYKVFFYIGIGFIVGIIIVSVLIYDVVKDYYLNKYKDKEYVLPVQEKIQEQIDKIVPAINSFTNEIIEEFKDGAKDNSKENNEEIIDDNKE